MNVTVDQMTKIMAHLLKPGKYGSVLIHIRDGEITGMQEKSDFNEKTLGSYADSLPEYIPPKKVVLRMPKTVKMCEKTVKSVKEEDTVIKERELSENESDKTVTVCEAKKPSEGEDTE